MVYAKVIDIKQDKKVKIFVLQEVGTAKISRYSEKDVYNAIQSGLIQIEYLSIDHYRPFVVLVDPMYYVNQLHKPYKDVTYTTSNKKAKKSNSKTVKIDRLRREVNTLEKKLEEAKKNGSNTSDIRDKLIVKRRELCKLQNIETDIETNIYSRNYNPRKGQGYTKL